MIPDEPPNPLRTGRGPSTRRRSCVAATRYRGLDSSRAGGRSAPRSDGCCGPLAVADKRLGVVDAGRGSWYKSQRHRSRENQLAKRISIINLFRPFVGQTSEIPDDGIISKSAMDDNDYEELDLAAASLFFR